MADTEAMRRLLKNDEHSKKIRSALETQNLTKIFNAKECMALYYVKMVTKYPMNIAEDDLDKLRIAGWDDGEILELNQVTSYFNYVNRMVLGLGINTDGDILGLSPNDSDDQSNWQHK